MKKYLTILFILLASTLLKADDYYFYQGSQINLKRHTDKIAVIFNDDLFTEKYKTELIKNALPSNSKISSVERNIFLITSLDPKGITTQELNSLKSQSNLIKFITPVYFERSKKIIILPADEFIVKLKNINDKEKLDHLNIFNGATISGNVGGEKGFLLKTINNNEKSSLELSNIYFNESIFEYAEPNFYYPDYCLLDYTPNDPLLNKQWALNNTGQTINVGGLHILGDQSSTIGLLNSDMDIDLAWDYQTGNNIVKIGILDTGIDSTHPDLRGNITGTGYDAYWDFNGVPRDSNGHGTNCAGIIGATFNNSLGVAGIASGCRIFSYKFYKANGTTNNVAIGRAFDTAVARGIGVFNNSWGGAAPSATIDSAINKAYTNARGGLGGIILFASGNAGYNPPDYPATLSSVICIGGSTPQDQKKAPGTGNEFFYGTNYGGNLAAVAPINCYTTDIQGSGGNDPGDYSENFGGSSCACANGTGVAALILSKATTLTESQVRDYMLRGCDKVDNVPYNTNGLYGKWNDYYGYGRLNAYHSVRLVVGVDWTPPSINHLNVRSINSTYPVSVTAEMVDQDGSAVDSATNKPKIFYRTNKNNAGWSSYDSSIYVSRSVNNFNFMIPGQGWETEVQYYLKAYDVGGYYSYFPAHAPLSDSLCVCYYKVGQLSTYSNVFPSFSLPDFTYTQSPNLAIPSFRVLDTKVDVYVTHTYDGDFELTLYSPDGNSNRNRKCIDAFNGDTTSGPTFGSGAGINGVSLNDSNSFFWKNLPPPYTGGNFKPDYTFRGLNGIDAGGNWSIIGFDRGPGDFGTADSIRLTFLRTTGTLSPNARLDSPADSIIDYGNAAVVTVKDFYLKNKGNSNLTISSYSITGTYASKFSVINTPPGTIVPLDSGLFQVQFDPSALEKTGSKQPLNNVESFENAGLQIITNDPSKSTFNVSLLNDAPLPVELSSFTSTVEKRNVKLKWVTSTEHNNRGFDIEVKPSTSNSSLIWLKKGFVTGAGNSEVPQEYSYSENNLITGKYSYRLKQIDVNGSYKYFYLGNEIIIDIPQTFYLDQNYPNPFNPVTKISFGLPVESNVNIKIYNIQGREVFDYSDKKPAGYYSLNFNASSLSSGIYFYKLEAETSVNKFVSIKKMMLVK
ncbi:hypothetical protein BH10BAC5_BH10BAC5_23770 [soil metagenome]